MPSRSPSLFHTLLHSRYLFLLNTMLILALGFAFGRDYLHARDIQKQIESLDAQSRALTKKTAVLSELENAVQTQSFIEREARLKLGMKKPGEQVVIVQDHAPSSDPGTVTVDASPALGSKDASLQVPNPTKWWNYFFQKSVYENQ